MRRIFVALATGLLAVTPALASDEADIVRLIRSWGSTPDSYCIDEEYVVDAVPPYEWHGAGACEQWRKDDEAFREQNDVTSAKVDCRQSPGHQDLRRARLRGGTDRRPIHTRR